MKIDKPYKNLHPYNVNYIKNPDQKTMQELALKHVPGIIRSKYGNLDRITKNKARMAKYTYIIVKPDNTQQYSHNTIPLNKAEILINAQKEYIESKGTLVEIDGYIGNKLDRAVGVQWLFTLEGINIAGMQQVLSFPRNIVESNDMLDKPFNPIFRIVYTPWMKAIDMPGEQAILVDLENYITYVIGPDYFGESKKGALRMFNDYIYKKGGLVLHAGMKSVKIGNTFLGMSIMGLSGTGKTTTTFSKQGDATYPIQDDMIAIWPDTQVSITENGAFAKTYGLKKETEPIIFKGTLNKDAWVENVFFNADGSYDFSKDVLTKNDVKRLKEILILTGANEKNINDYIEGRVRLEDKIDKYGIPYDGWDFLVWTQNGRSIIPMKAIENAGDLNDIPSIKFMGILNRDEGKDAATPGIIKFSSPEQAAGYFMLGETSKTSAAGKERGKTRSPFTQPFFPLEFGLQAIRFSELVAKMPDVVLWLMNTGYVGGDALDTKNGKALKVKISHSSAMLEALIKNEIVWKEDPDFHYYIVDTTNPKNKELLKVVPEKILNPVKLFEEQNRMEEYQAWIKKMKTERKKFLQKYRVDEEIINAVIR